MGDGGHAVLGVDPERLDGAGLGVDPADRHGLVGAIAANHRLPSRSAAASWGSEPTRDGVPLVQSLPSLGGSATGSAWSGLSARRIRVNTARAASPDGRGRVVI